MCSAAFKNEVTSNFSSVHLRTAWRIYGTHSHHRSRRVSASIGSVVVALPIDDNVVTALPMREVSSAPASSPSPRYLAAISQEGDFRRCRSLAIIPPRGCARRGTPAGCNRLAFTTTFASLLVVVLSDLRRFRSRPPNQRGGAQLGGFLFFFGRPGGRYLTPILMPSIFAMISLRPSFRPCS